MKIQEVIEAVKEQMAHQKLVQEVYGHRKVEDKALEGNEIILKALEKQIPKRIIQSEWNSLILDCPTCEASLYNCESDNHCYNCGQAIDWSTDEN